MKVSIVIPTFNEAESIAGQVRRCLGLVPRPEVRVADGASTDSTLLLAVRAGAVALACSGRGRALQMNLGASAANGEALIFLHADVLLPQDAYSAMLQTLQDSRVIGGAFRRRFDTPSPLLRLGCHLADLRGMSLGLFLGDQAMFVRREHFLALGGFPDMLLFEDLAFSRRLARRGATRLVRETVLASGRRFRREGNLRRLTLNLWLTLLYFSGADTDQLARRYYPGYFCGTAAGGKRLQARQKAVGGGP